MRGGVFALQLKPKFGLLQLVCVLRGNAHDVLELWKEARLVHEVVDVAVYLKINNWK
jgi:hypothetical protein